MSSPKFASDFREKQFYSLFAEFVDDYLNTEKGRQHLEGYRRSADEGSQNFRLVREAVESGEDATALVLTKLLPHNDTRPHREEGMWVSMAPAITSDIRKWYEADNTVSPENWPIVSENIYNFFTASLNTQDNDTQPGESFADNPLSKGFQSGMLTPLLNAVDPNRFAIINSKSVKLLNYFTPEKYDGNIAEYGRSNQAMLDFARSINDSLVVRFELPDIMPSCSDIG